jgi:hypothetical protein
MARKKKKITQPIKEVEIINRRTKKYRKINVAQKEIIVYNDSLNEFQLLTPLSSSYEQGNDSENGRER